MKGAKGCTILPTPFSPKKATLVQTDQLMDMWSTVQLSALHFVRS